ncbi:MAG: ATP-binding cassette domain-containing protein, partial [Pseudomonadota bacterium]
MVEPVLRCDGIEVRFGPVTAVAGFTFAFYAGRTYAVIGPNGAGKTTLMNALSGRVEVAAGRVLLDGDDITALAAHRRARAGLGRSFQVTQVFPGFSVRDNLRIAALGHERDSGVFWTVLGRRRALQERADQVLEDIGLTTRAATPAESLSHGEQRALELG